MWSFRNTTRQIFSFLSMKHQSSRWSPLCPSASINETLLFVVIRSKPLMHLYLDPSTLISGVRPQTGSYCLRRKTCPFGTMATTEKLHMATCDWDINACVSMWSCFMVEEAIKLNGKSIRNLVRESQNYTKSRCRQQSHHFIASLNVDYVSHK